MKVVTILLKYDYGLEKRGISLEKNLLLPAIKKNVEEVSEFWIEDNGFPDNINLLQEKILKFCEIESPDVVFFVLMKSEVRIDTLQKLSEKYITMNWFCDDQWRFETFTKFIAPKLHYSITNDKYSLMKYYALKSKVLLSQWANKSCMESINFEKNKYIYDITFVGGKNIVREWYIYELEKSGYKVECFGFGWNNGKVSYEKMNEIFLTSKINLNLSNTIQTDYKFIKFVKRKLLKNIFINSFKIRQFKYNIREILYCLKTLKSFNKPDAKKAEQLKARNFEIPGNGGFQLSHYILGIEDYYNIGEEIAVFSNICDLKKQVNYYLGNENIRENIRKKSYIKTRTYTYENRFKKIFEDIKLCEKLV